GWVVEVPGILRETDKVPNGGIRPPNALKRGSLQLLRHARHEKSANISGGPDRIEGRKRFRIERRFTFLRPRRGVRRRLALVFHARFGLRLLAGLLCFALGLLLAAGPALKKFLLLAHDLSSFAGTPRASASGSARLR